MDYTNAKSLEAPLQEADEDGDHSVGRKYWMRARSRVQFVLRMTGDNKDFMRLSGRVFKPEDMNGSSRIERSLSDFAAKTAKSAGNLLAPPDKPIPPKPDEVELQTNGEAIVNLLNNCLGSGMLSMGYAIGKAGILPTLVTMLLSAYLNRYTLHLNIRSNQIAHTDPSTAALGEATFGAPGKIALILLYSTFGFLCCVSYVDASADAVAGLLELVVGSAPPTMPTLVGCWAVLLLPTTLLRSLKAVALLSFVAFLGGIVMLIAVTLYCLSELLDKGFPSVADLAWVAPSLGDFGQAFPILLLVFSIQAGGGVVLGTMRDASESNMRAVSRNAYLLVLFMDFLIGIIAYVTFTSDVQGNVLLNFSPSSWTAIIARFALLDLVVLSYMIMMVPCKLAVIDLFFDKNEARQEASPAEFYGVTLGLNILALLVACSVSDLSIVLSLNGAVCTNLVAFVLPMMLYLKARKGGPGGVNIFSTSNTASLGLLVFGVFSLCVGTYQVIGSMAS